MSDEIRESAADDAAEDAFEGRAEEAADDTGAGAAQSAGTPPAGEEIPAEPEADPQQDAAIEEAMSEAIADGPSASVPSGAAESGFAAAASDGDAGPTVRRAEFDALGEPAGRGDQGNIELLLDVRLPVTVELGRTEVEVGEILRFGPGSIIELSKEANQPVDLLVNGVLVARGEVVVVEENFGIRLTTLVSPEERIRALGAAA